MTAESPLLGLAELQALAQQPHRACQCPLADCTGWTSVPGHRWPGSALVAVGTLRHAEGAEPTFEEWHPQRTRIDSPDAPLAVHHYPCNRAEVFACKQCQQVVLKYDETGGYYFDSRARRVHSPSLLCDPSPP